MVDNILNGKKLVRIQHNLSASVVFVEYNAPLKSKCTCICLRKGKSLKGWEMLLVIVPRIRSQPLQKKQLKEGHAAKGWWIN